METTTEVQVIETNESALYLITKAEIDTAIATAKAFPRSLAEFYKKAIEMSTVSESVAESCFYSIPRQNKIIEGSSVRLAEIIAATYKNIRAGSRVIANDGKTITAQGICHDLENNNSVTIEVKVRITGKDGRTFSEDMQTLTGNSACAKAYRNAIFKVIPLAMINEIADAARLCAKGTQATLEKRRSAAFEYFIGLKVTEKQIFDVLGVMGMIEIDLDKLAILTGIKSAYRNEGVSLKELFNPKAETQEPPTPPTQIEVELARLKAMLQSCTTIADLELLAKNNPDFDANLIAERKKELQPETESEKTLKAKEYAYELMSEKVRSSDKGLTLAHEIATLKGEVK